MKKFEQLNKVQRSQLQILLKEKKSLAQIALTMKLSRQTLYREILRNSYMVNFDLIGRKMSCIYFKTCVKNHWNQGGMVCSPNCEKYTPGRQDCLRSYPFVCNFCCKKTLCKYLHYYYDPDNASIEYHTRISTANKKPKIANEIIRKINLIVSPLVKQGQSIEAILMNHPEIEVSALTIRNWVKDGYLDCKLSQLRMTGRRVSSKRYDYSLKPSHIRLSEAKIGHKYTEYLMYIKEHPHCLTIQLDSVIGSFDGKLTVLTIHIVEHKFQFGILLETHTKEEVTKKYGALLDKLLAYQNETGVALYSHFIECQLTDNGFEFDDLLKFTDKDPNFHLFYCHPYSSFEKAECERNHVLVRYIQYKGWNFDSLSQSDIDLLFSHIDSYPRKSLKNKTPYQSVLEDSRLGKEFLDLIGINKVECDDVILNPSLLKKIKK